MSLRSSTHAGLGYGIASILLRVGLVSKSRASLTIFPDPNRILLPQMNTPNRSRGRRAPRPSADFRTYGSSLACLSEFPRQNTGQLPAQKLAPLSPAAACLFFKKSTLPPAAYHKSTLQHNVLFSRRGFSPCAPTALTKIISTKAGRMIIDA